MVDFSIPPGCPHHPSQMPSSNMDLRCFMLLFFFYPYLLIPQVGREGCVNNAKQTLNVRAKNSQFPSIVSLVSTACFMHFIISAGASAERRQGEGGLAVMGIAYFCERWRFKKIQNFIWKANLTAPWSGNPAKILLWINNTYHTHIYNVCICCFYSRELKSWFKVSGLDSLGFQWEKEQKWRDKKQKGEMESGKMLERG